MITLWDKTDTGQKEHFLSFSIGEKHGLLYLRDIEKSESVKLPQELFRVRYLAGKNILCTNVTKDRFELRVANKNKKASALLLITSLCARKSVRPFLCNDITDSTLWKDYLEETDNFDFSDPLIQKVSKEIITDKGPYLWGDINSYTKASSAFNWIRNNISYSILPRPVVEQIAENIRSQSLEKPDVYRALQTSFNHVLPDKLFELASRVNMPDHIVDPYKQALYITTKFGPLWNLFFHTWEGKKTRSASRTMADKTGKCDCFSNVFVALCRSMGVPTRTLLGYFRGISYHAWAAVYLSPYGWVEVDPTNGASLFCFNQKDYFYEFLKSDFIGEKFIVSINKNLDRNCLKRCRTFYESVERHPSFEEISSVLYLN